MRITFLLLILISISFAHKLNLFLSQEGNNVYASAYFASGNFCQNCEVLVKDGKGNLLETGKTDKNGEFIITKLDSKIIVDVKTLEGHAARYSLNIEPVTLKKEEKIKEINELEKQIEKLEFENKLLKEKVEQNEILKMIFALLAIFGVFFVLKRLKRE